MYKRQLYNRGGKGYNNINIESGVAAVSRCGNVWKKTMKLYWKTVEPALHAAALHDAAYALLFEKLEAEWGITGVKIEKTPKGKP